MLKHAYDHFYHRPSPREQISPCWLPRVFCLPLAPDREGFDVTSSVMQLDLGSSAPRESRKDFPTALVPERQLRRGHSVRILAGIQTLKKRRPLHSATTNVIGPAHERAILVVIQFDGSPGSQCDALLIFLEKMRC